MSGPGNGYRWDAEEYARSSSAQQAWARELIDTLSLRGDEAVLDIGCGDGKVTAEIARRVPRGRVVGVDSSEDMVRAAVAAWPSAPGMSVEFRVLDARLLDFRAEFDAVFSNAVLHWVHDQPAVLHGVARALRPGGRLSFQMGGRGNGAGIFAVARELTVDTRWASNFSGFAFPWSFLGPEEYAPLCREAGLTVKRIQLLPRTMRQRGRGGLAGWIRTTWLPYLERIPADRREAFIDAALDLYLARRPLAPDGTAEVEMVRLQVEAEKG